MKNKVVITAVLAAALAVSGASGAQAAGSSSNAKFVNYVHAHDSVTRHVSAKTLKDFGHLICQDLKLGVTKHSLIAHSPSGASKLLMRVSIKGATKYLCPGE